MNDQELMRLAQQGDDAAWEALVRQEQQAVFRHAYLLTGNADDAQDVAQEAFVRAFRSIDRFDPDRPLRPWLLRITSNLASNRRRSVARFFSALSRAARDTPEPVLASADTRRLAQQEESAALWQAIRRLRRTDQEVIYLRYFAELSVADTAEALGVAQGTVKSRLSRATDRLRAVIEADFPDLSERRLA
ncbi:MAG: RNA polymerase sigma factor [Anaerolineae bacterium]|nr:RNA polymerase sigma factor [Anaerolineae bacterium]